MVEQGAWLDEWMYTMMMQGCHIGLSLSSFVCMMLHNLYKSFELKCLPKLAKGSLWYKLKLNL